MYQKVLVPLDGSKLAECVLEHVEQLAKGCNTEVVVLISVTERVTGRTPAPEAREVYGDDVPITIGKKQRQAERYLDRIAKRLAKKGVKVLTAVLLGNPAEEIVHYAEKMVVDLLLWPVMVGLVSAAGLTAAWPTKSSEPAPYPS